VNGSDIILGKKYRDTVSGAEGVCVGKSVWLTGCETVGLQGPVDKDGKMPDSQWFDAIRIEAVSDDVNPAFREPTGKGGPCVQQKCPNT
jgi:hypothetical protein